MVELINPYIAGAPVTEARMFFGREDVFQWIENSIAGQYADHILVIHGQRRVGKTSVLKQLGNRLPKRYIPVFFDLQGRTHTTLDRFLWWLAREIVRVLKQDRGIEVPVPEKDVFAADIEYFEHRFLPDLRPALGSNTLLLTFDEFDNLEESEVKEELARPLTDYLRRLMGNGGLNFIFSIGSSGRKLENMQAAYTEFFKTALYKKISFLNEEQTRNLITRPVEHIIEYDKRAATRIYQIAGGHPYFTQLTCHELFAKCQQSEERLIKEADVESVLDDVVERGTVNLKFVWDEATDIEKWGLASLAQVEKTDNRSVGDYLRRNRVRFSENDLNSGLLHLREKDILTAENHFVIHLLKLWLTKNRPIEQVREELTEVNPIANRYIEIGLEFKDSQLYEKAIESFQEALTVSRDNIQAQVNIGLVYMDMKVYDKAIVEFEKALTMDDEDVAARAGLCDAHLSLGDTALAKGRIKEAVLSYQRVLAINAEHTEARGRMAEIACQRAEKALADGKDEEALSAFGEALKFTPEDPALLLRVDQVRAEKKAKVLTALTTRSEKEAAARNWEGAVKLMEDALLLAPDDASIQGKLTEFRTEKEKARLDALLVKAEAAIKSARWEEAIESLTVVLAAKPDEAIEIKLTEVRAKYRDAKLNELKAQARGFTRIERFDDALSAWKAYLALEPVDLESAEREIELVKKAQALATSYVEAQKAFAKRDYNKAVSILKNIISEDENYKDTSRLLAESIELRRTTRKWWQSRWFLGSISGLLVLVIGWFAFRAGLPWMNALLTTPTLIPASTSVTGVVPSPDMTATTPPTATAIFTPVPSSWKRLNSGQFLPRDLITAIVIDPNDSGVLYIGTDNAGIYKSIDGGLSWQPIHNGLGRAKIFSLVMDPRDSKRLYASTRLGGVYRTDDGGMTWQAVNSGINTQESEWVAIVVMDAQDSQHLYFTNSNGLYETTNGGHSWQEVKDQADCPQSLVGLFVNPFDGENLFAVEYSDADSACPGGVYQTLDGGITWTVTDLQSQIIPRNAPWIEPSTFQSLYVALQEGLWISNDKNNIWEEFMSRCTTVAFGPLDPSLAYCGTSNQLYKTSDGGKQWAIIAEVDFEEASSLAVSPQENNTLYWGTTGLYKSIDGGKLWNEFSSGLGGIAWELKSSSADPSLLFAQGLDINLYRSADGGKSWTSINTANLGNSMYFDKTAATIFILQRGSDNTIGISRDNGETWEQIHLPLPDAYPYSIAGHPTIANRLFVTYSRDNPPYIFYSDDLGKTWQETTGMQSVHDARLFFDHEQGDIVYAIGDLDFFRSQDGGTTWNSCNSVPFDVWASVTDARAAVDPRNSNRLYIATRGNGIVVSDDGCKTWEKSNTGLESLFINTVTLDPANPDVLYVGTDGGAYVSSDAGETWGQINDGLLGATVVYSITVDKDGNVYAATPSGIFQLERN